MSHYYTPPQGGDGGGKGVLEGGDNAAAGAVAYRDSAAVWPPHIAADPSSARELTAEEKEAFVQSISLMANSQLCSTLCTVAFGLSFFVAMLVIGISRLGEVCEYPIANVNIAFAGCGLLINVLTVGLALRVRYASLMVTSKIVRRGMEEEGKASSVEDVSDLAPRVGVELRVRRHLARMQSWQAALATPSVLLSLGFLIAASTMVFRTDATACDPLLYRWTLAWVATYYALASGAVLLGVCLCVCSVAAFSAARGDALRSASARSLS